MDIKQQLRLLFGIFLLIPSVLNAEDRPGFYSAEHQTFERTVSKFVLEGSVGGDSTAGTQTDGQGNRYAYSGNMDNENLEISFDTAHFYKFSYGATIGKVNASASNSNASPSGTVTNKSSNDMRYWNLRMSYLLSPEDNVVASIDQQYSSSADQTAHRFHLSYNKLFSPNLSLFGRVSGLWGDELLTNGIKHVGGGLNYKQISDNLELDGTLNVHKATGESRSKVSGIRRASEESYKGLVSTGAIRIKRKAARFGLIGSFSVSDRNGSPKIFSGGPQYIYTGSNYEITLTGDYRVSRSDDIASQSGVTSYFDNVTEGIKVSYVRELSDGYYLNTSIDRSWNSSGSSLIGSPSQSSGTGEQWNINLGLTMQF